MGSASVYRNLDSEFFTDDAKFLLLPLTNCSDTCLKIMKQLWTEPLFRWFIFSQSKTYPLDSVIFLRQHSRGPYGQIINFPASLGNLNHLRKIFGPTNHLLCSYSFLIWIFNKSIVQTLNYFYIICKNWCPLLFVKRWGEHDASVFRLIEYKRKKFWEEKASNVLILLVFSNFYCANPEKVKRFLKFLDQSFFTL